MTKRTKPAAPLALPPDIIIPLGTLTAHPGTRPRAISLIIGPHGVRVQLEEIGGYVPLLDCAEFWTPADAAEALAERYPPTALWLDDLGTAYASAVTDGCRDDPQTWVVAHTGGYIILDTNPGGARVIVWTGPGAREQTRLVRDWLSLALRATPVRRRDSGTLSWEIVVGVLHG